MKYLPSRKASKGLLLAASSLMDTFSVRSASGTQHSRNMMPQTNKVAACSRKVARMENSPTTPPIR